MVIPILQKKTLRPGEAKWLTPGGTERMQQRQGLTRGGYGFRSVLGLAQGQRYHLGINSRPCPANPIVHLRLEEFLRGSGTCGGHLEMCGSFLALVIWGGGNH